MKNKTIDTVIGSEFRRIRRIQDLTQAEVAKHFNWTQQNINKMERGASMSITRFLDYCKFYKQNPVQFFALIIEKYKSGK